MQTTQFKSLLSNPSQTILIKIHPFDGIHYIWSYYVTMNSKHEDFTGKKTVGDVELFVTSGKNLTNAQHTGAEKHQMCLHPHIIFDKADRSTSNSVFKSTWCEEKSMCRWFPNFLKSKAALQFEPVFCAQRGGSISLSIHITTWEGKPLSELPLPQAVHTHGGGLRLSSMMYKFATSASNSFFKSILQGTIYYNLRQVIIILVSRQTVGFSWYFVQPGATCALSTRICGRAIFQKNIAGACLHNVSCHWQTLLFYVEKNTSQSLSHWVHINLKKQTAFYMSRLSCSIF